MIAAWESSDLWRYVFSLLFISINIISYVLELFKVDIYPISLKTLWGQKLDIMCSYFFNGEGENPMKK